MAIQYEVEQLREMFEKDMNREAISIKPDKGWERGVPLCPCAPGLQCDVTTTRKAITEMHGQKNCLPGQPCFVRTMLYGTSSL